MINIEEKVLNYVYIINLKKYCGGVEWFLMRLNFILTFQFIFSSTKVALA